MRHVITTALLAGALAAVPAVGFAAAPRVVTAKGVQHAQAAAIHATRGIVKSMDANTLVITRQGKPHSEMTFSLNASTRRAGTIRVGTPVSVRYERDGKADVATGISARNPQPEVARAHASTVK